MSKDSQRVTRKNYFLIFVSVLLAALFTAFVFYSIQATVGGTPNFLVTFAISIVVGIVVFWLAFLGTDLFRRWDHAARALQSSRKGSPADRLHGVQDLHATGKQSLSYIQSVQQGDVRGILGAFTRWEEGFLLDRYVLPGLQAAIHDVDANVRRYAVQALREIGR